MPRPPNTEKRRQQILDGFQQVLASSGYSGATISAIAAAADLSPGLLHYHFHSKQEILLALLDRLQKRVELRFEKFCRTREANSLERLRSYLDAHVALGDGADPGAVACWVAIGVEAIHQPEVGGLYRRIQEQRLEMLQSLLRECLLEQGRLVEMVPSLAAALLSHIEGSFQLSVATPGLLPMGFASPTLGLYLEALLAAQPLK